MTVLLIIIHVLVSLFLIGVVLIQSGKGAEMGASFGAASSHTIFGSRGPGSFLGKLTTGAAILFMITSFSLAFVGSNKGGSSVIPEQTEAPVLPQSPAPDAKQIPQAAPAVPGAPVNK